MKLKIEKVFKDKNTGERYDIGKVIEFEEDRAKELLSDERHLVSEVKPKTTSKRSKK